MAVTESLEAEGLHLWQIVSIIILLLLPIAYQLSDTFKFYFRTFFYIASVMVIGFVSIFYSIFRPRNTENHFFVARLSRFLYEVLGVEIEVRGRENLGDGDHKPGILVINHQSSLDMLPLFHVWPKDTVCLAKKELWYSGTFGLAAWLCGTIYINRLNHEHARKTMEDTANLIKNKKLKVVIFPEGTRNSGDSFLPFKKGAFHLAVQGQVPVIPVVFSSFKHFYDKSKRKFEPGKVIVEFLPKIPTEGLTSSDVTELTEKTRNAMLEVYGRISAEAAKSL